ncbi:IPP transferase-domain-containing protein [Fomitopsis serialis]|uniref:IPP transferase-domain-containing protein n=1 Tax=Fomitopsis serialis TaxID=139415 RepID=UPI002007FA13|nr:IPP transferase-domain-containing protein [Neoantrodia serialis]KAH9934858.1 IPP transferase-domain-containing protein [Neoantrodia serialis]
MTAHEEFTMGSLRPLIAICGTTGVGKSKLAVINTTMHGNCGARVINADAMQVYSGMDIITNKIPTEEREAFKRPGEQYIITEWVKDAMRAIDETHRMGQVPIVVGGTSYWIQHLLFPNRLISMENSSRGSADQSTVSENLARSLSSLPSELLDLFYAVPTQAPSATDQPELAVALYKLWPQRFHWRDTRKVLRQLSIIKESGRLSSEILAEQWQVASRPRYRTLMFWLYAKPDILKPRLDLRVDQMVEQGLLDEIRDLRAQLSTGSAQTSLLEDPDARNESDDDSVDVDYTLGIYQAIGYKEFREYLSAPVHNEELFQEALQSMKTATRRYAKRQIKWIRNQLLPEAQTANSCSQAEEGCDVVPTYVLDATEPASWDANVREAAQGITDAFLNSDELPDPTLLSDTARDLLVENKPKDIIHPRKVICQVCTHDEERPVMMEEGAQWKGHLRTRSHRKRARKLHMRKLNEGALTDGPPEGESSDTSEEISYGTNTLYT